MVEDPPEPRYGWVLKIYLPQATAVASSNSNRSAPAIAAFDGATGQLLFSPDPRHGAPFSGFTLPGNETALRMFLAQATSGDPHIFYEFRADAVAPPEGIAMPLSSGGRAGLRYVRLTVDGSFEVQTIAEFPPTEDPSKIAPATLLMEAREAAVTNEGVPFLMGVRLTPPGSFLLFPEGGRWMEDTFPGLALTSVSMSPSGSIHLCGADLTKGRGELVLVTGSLRGPWQFQEVFPGKPINRCELSHGTEEAPQLVFDSAPDDEGIAAGGRVLRHAEPTDQGWKVQAIPIEVEADPRPFDLARTRDGALWLGLELSDRALLLAKRGSNWTDESPPEFRDIPQMPVALDGEDRPHVVMEATGVWTWSWAPQDLEAREPETEPAP